MEGGARAVEDEEVDEEGEEGDGLKVGGRVQRWSRGRSWE